MKTSLFKSLNKNTYQGSRFSIAAFLLLSAILPFSGCDSPSPIGEGIDNNEDDIVTQVIELDNITTIKGNAYSGRIEFSTIGFTNDPLYGTLRGITLLKPSISTSEVDSIADTDILQLRLVFGEEKYGNANSTSTYEIFEVEEFWRGNELRYNDEVEINFSSKVGEFQVQDQDTVDVELSDAWQEKYLGYYNASSQRDSLYRNEFRGLAIVPSEGNDRLQFLSYRPEEDDDDNLLLHTAVSLIVSSTEDNGGEDEEEEELRVFSMNDHGTVFTRQNEPEYSETYVLHSGENVLRVDLNLLEEELESNNVVGAQLFFGVRPPDESLYVRPEAESMRGFGFQEEPSDLRAEIFLNSAPFPGTLDEETGLFRIEITNYVLNEIFGDEDPGYLYISLPENGIIYTTELYDQNGPENERPRLVITSVKSGS